MKSSSKRKPQQSSRAKIVVPLIVLAVVFVTIGLGIGYFKKDLYTVMKVPEFNLTDQNNKKINNHDMLGKVYLVEFSTANVLLYAL